MHRNWIWIKRLVGASAGVYAHADCATKEEVAGHRSTAGSAKLAFDFHSLRRVSWFTHGYTKGLGFPLLNEFHRCNAMFAGRKSDIGSRGIAGNAKFVVDAACDRRARGETQKWQEQ